MSSTLNIYYNSSQLANKLSPALDLVLRGYIAYVFFISGLTKIQSWDSTLFLFEEEYQVPIIPYELAAYLATGAELALPILLILGLFTRFSALGLFILNTVAVYSYGHALSDAGLWQHYLWGSLLAILLVHGACCVSADRFIQNRYLVKK